MEEILIPNATIEIKHFKAQAVQKTTLREGLKLLLLFLIGGFIYGAIEIIYKGETHFSMFITGGFCFIICGGLNSYFRRDMPLLIQMAISSVAITLLEFICGCIVNLWLNLNVWDYSALPFNVYGQICLLFVGIWFALSFVGIVLDDFFRFGMFGEAMPHYVMIRKKVPADAAASAEG